MPITRAERQRVSRISSGVSATLTIMRLVFSSCIVLFSRENHLNPLLKYGCSRLRVRLRSVRLLRRSRPYILRRVFIFSLSPGRREIMELIVSRYESLPSARTAACSPSSDTGCVVFPAACSASFSALLRSCIL